MTMHHGAYRNTLRSAFLALAIVLAVLGAISQQPHAAHAASLQHYSLCSQTKMIEVEDTGYTQPDFDDVQIKVGLNVLADINSTRDNIYYCGKMRGITKIVQGCGPYATETFVTGMRQWYLHNPGQFVPWGYGDGSSRICTSDTNPTWADTGWVNVPESAIYCANYTWDALAGAGNPLGAQAITNKWCY